MTRAPAEHKFSMRIAALFLAILCILMLCPTAFARTYVITDGDHTFTYTTFATDPAEVLTQAGMALSGQDSYTTAGGDTITIRRALELNLIYRGEEISVTSMGETVGELVSRLGLDIGSHDVLSHAPDTPVADGMELRIDSVITRQEVYTTTIPHEINYCADPSLPRGREEVYVPGQDGELLCTAEVTYVNGAETHREVTDRKQTIAPVTEIIGQGTGEIPEPETIDMPVIRDSYIIMPSGEILTYYKTDNVTATGYTHTDAGCDMITSTGTTVHYGTAAVDPRFIPYGTRMLIVSHDAERYYGIATAEDCGGAIKRDRMDLYFPTYQECIEFGRRRCTIYFLG